MTYKHNHDTDITFTCECSETLVVHAGEEIRCFNCGRLYRPHLVEIEHERMQQLDKNITDKDIHLAVMSLSDYRIKVYLQEIIQMIRDDKLSPQPIKEIYLPYGLWNALLKVKNDNQS